MEVHLLFFNSNKWFAYFDNWKVFASCAFMSGECAGRVVQRWA